MGDLHAGRGNLQSWLPPKLSWWFKSLCVYHQALVKAENKYCNLQMRD